MKKLVPESNLIDEISKSIDAFLKENKINHYDYETGLLGFALYYAYLFKYTKKEEFKQKASGLFIESIRSFDPNNFYKIHGGDSLDAHLSQIGRLVIFFKKNNFIEDLDIEDVLNQLDEVLVELMYSKINVKDFDYSSGALASGFYLIKRYPQNQKLKNHLAFLANSIYELSEKDGSGNLYWFSPSLNNRVYIGISHGSSLIISFISSLYNCDIEKDICKNILDKASRFVIKQYRKTKFKGLFPNMVGDEIDNMQFSLCYGDIGVGYALYKASLVLNSDYLKTFSLSILIDCLSRKKSDNLTLDASIYYGAAGLAIAFRKVYEIVEDERFLLKGKYWLSKIEDYKIHKNEYAGFKSRLLDNDSLWNLSMGWGIIGIATTLISYETDDDATLSDLTFFA